MLKVLTVRVLSFIFDPRSYFIFFVTGGPQHTIFASFSAAVFVAGGTGITFALSVIQDLVQKDLRGASRLKIIELIWIVPDPACLAPVLPTLSMLVQQSVFTPLRISVFYTRAPTGKQPAFFVAASAGPFAASGVEGSPFSPSHAPPPGSAAAQSQRRSLVPPNLSSVQQPTHFPPGLTLAPGKPRLLKFFEHAINRAVTLGHSNPKDEVLSLTGLIVSVCGPVSMADDIATAVSGIDPVRRDQVGGVEVHEEVFGW